MEPVAYRSTNEEYPVVCTDRDCRNWATEVQDAELTPMTQADVDRYQDDRLEGHPVRCECGVALDSYNVRFERYVGARR